MTTYEFYKSRGICTWCHRENAVPGLTVCEACRKRMAAWWARHKKQHSANAMARTRRLKEAGLCVRCGKQPAVKGGFCETCNLFVRVKRRIIYKRKRRGTWTGKFWDEETIRKICLGVLREWGAI